MFLVWELIPELGLTTGLESKVGFRPGVPNGFGGDKNGPEGVSVPETVLVTDSTGCVTLSSELTER